MITTPLEFEDEVRRIARLLWPEAEFDGAAKHGQRERDGVFRTTDFIHVIECTTSRAKKKATDDATKIAKLMRSLQARYPDRFIKGWFITKDEPTADQREAVKAVVLKNRFQVVCASFDQFRSRLIDARRYLELRDRYAFGSIRDPETGSEEYEFTYLPLPIFSREGESFTISSLAAVLKAGKPIVLLGDYGAGKSSTLKQLYRILASDFWANEALAFPLLLNLRDHHGQVDPVEALERHARKIGFPDPPALVRAWRAGYALVLLDGFDEIAAAGWAGKTKTLRDLRFRSMELLRRFCREAPNPQHIILAGRAHYFDNQSELRRALAVGRDVLILELGEFAEDEVRAYLEEHGWRGEIPGWLPSRPLLLAYLARRGLIMKALDARETVSPPAGWAALLDKVASRESEIEAGLDPSTVRRLIEELAMKARNSVDGLGPLTPDIIIQTFQDVCGYPPDDQGAVLLQRLPGLGASQDEDGSRFFVDRDFAEAARGGGICSLIENPYELRDDPDSWQSTITTLAADVATLRCTAMNYTDGKVRAALQYVAENSPRGDVLSADLLLVLNSMGGNHKEPRIFIRDVLIQELFLEGSGRDFTGVEFQDCIFGMVAIGSDFSNKLFPLFLRCHFGRIEGRTGQRDLPASAFRDCTYDEFEESSQTTSGIMNLNLPLGTKVVLSILKKLYRQSGSGRKESALYRGLDARARELVPEALSLLRKEDFAARTRHGTEIVWVPTRMNDSRRRALGMLAAPNASPDRLLKASRDLGG